MLQKSWRQVHMLTATGSSVVYYLLQAVAFHISFQCLFLLLTVCCWKIQKFPFFFHVLIDFSYSVWLVAGIFSSFPFPVHHLRDFSCF